MSGVRVPHCPPTPPPETPKPRHPIPSAVIPAGNPLLLLPLLLLLPFGWLDAMSKCFKAEDVVHAGELELVDKDGASVTCEMVLMSEWKARIHYTLAGE